MTPPAIDADGDAEVVPDPASPSSRSEDLRRVLGWRALEILVLASFAVAQPLFSLLGANATFFVAHGIMGSRLVLFALVVVLLPPLAFVAVDGLAAVADARVGRVVHATLLGVLLALAVGPHIERAGGLTGLVSVLLLIAIAALAAAMFWHSVIATRVVRYAWFAPILFVGLLLFTSQASSLLRDADRAQAVAATRSDVPVVWVVFDQFPLAFMVDEEGALLEERYPNFARLAALSTWYPTTSSIATNTSVSMPSMLSGRIAENGALPTVSAYPNNLFTLLGQSFAVHADEYVTQLCPDAICGQDTSDSVEASTAKDTWAVFVRTVLAEDVADRFVPRVDDRWHDFGEAERTSAAYVTDEAQTADDIQRQRLAEDDDRVRFDRFLDGIATGGVPSLHYIHLFQPHEPLRFLPDGRGYDRVRSFRVEEDGSWPENQEMIDQLLQAYVLQTMHADREVGRMLDRLEDTGLLEDALIVVTSDHGVSLSPGTLNRVYAAETIDDLLPVPLFVKAPGQMQAEIDTRLAQQHDLLPTVLDLLGIDHGELDFDGQSLVGPESAGPAELILGSEVVELDSLPVAARSDTIRRLHDLMPVPDDPYLFGEHAQLVGRSASDVAVGESELVADVTMAGQLAAVDLDGLTVPANFYGTITGRDESVDVAVAVNGTIAGVGASFYADAWHMAVMVDPSYLVDGTNTFGIYEVTDEGLLTIATG